MKWSEHEKEFVHRLCKWIVKLGAKGVLKLVQECEELTGFIFGPSNDMSES